MGSSQSTNSTNLIMSAVEDASTTILNNSKDASEQDQLLTFINNQGNVYICNNDFTIEACVCSDNLLKAFSSQQAQEKMVSKIAQTATSLTSGLNFTGSSSVSNNNLQAALDASINIITNIRQNCVTSLAQTQDFYFNGNKGNIYIEGNNVTEVANIFTKCIQNTVSQNSAMQDLQSTITQSASATTEGVSIWGLALLILGVLFILIGLPLLFAAKTISAVIQDVLKYLIPLTSLGLIGTGIYFLVTYFKNKGISEMATFQYSNLLMNTAGCTVPDSSPGMYSPTGASTLKIKDAIDMCTNDPNCKALDWQPAQGTTAQIVNFYTSSSDSTDPGCTTPLVNTQGAYVTSVNSTLFTGSDSSNITNPYPGQKSGDVWLNTSNGDIYVSKIIKRTPLTLKWDNSGVPNLFTIVDISTQPQPNGVQIITLKDATPGANGFDPSLVPYTYTGLIVVSGINNTNMPIYYKTKGVDSNNPGTTNQATDTNGNTVSITATSFVVPDYNSVPWSAIKKSPDNSNLIYGFILLGSGLLLLLIYIIQTIFQRRSATSTSS